MKVNLTRNICLPCEMSEGEVEDIVEEALDMGRQEKERPPSGPRHCREPAGHQDRGRRSGDFEGPLPPLSRLL